MGFPNEGHLTHTYKGTAPTTIDSNASARDDYYGGSDKTSKTNSTIKRAQTIVEKNI